MGRALQTLQVLAVLLVATAAVFGLLAGGGREAMTAHIRWGFLVAIFASFAHSMTLFYLIGSSGNVKEAIRPHGWREPWLPEMARFHRVLSPWLTFAIIAAIASVITGGGAHTRVWPLWLHTGTVIAALALNIGAAAKAIRVIGENVRLQGRLDRALRDAERRGSAAS